jgi:head-tail adaptor
MSALQAAALRERVTIRLPVTTSDETAGTPIVLEANVPAAIQAEAARQVVTDGQLSGALTYRVTLRFRTDVTAHHELLWGTRVLHIVGLWDVDGLRRWLAARCVETT